MMATSLLPLNGTEPVVWYAVTSPIPSCIPAIAQSPVYPLDLKMNWSLACGNPQPKLDTNKHFHIFVGDLSPEAETHHLREAFAPFGQISDCKIIRDPQTLKSKGYGFVSFTKREDAENAITHMNGQRIGCRAIRTNWAMRKPPAFGQKDVSLKPMSFEEVYSQSSPTNCTVYCGGILTALTDDVIHQSFSVFGPIQEIRVFKEKGYAFIRFSSKEVATQAIVSMNGVEINGHTVKCSWGKESSDSPGPASSPNQLPSVTPVAPPQNYSSSTFPGNPGYGGSGGGGSGGQSVNYWPPSGQQNYPPLAHLQQPGFLQPLLQQGYTIATYGGIPGGQWPSVGIGTAHAQQYFLQQQGIIGYPI